MCVCFALKQKTDIGTVRETFFINQVGSCHNLKYPPKGDFLVDDRYLFEIGGKTKKFNQIKDIENSFLAIDDVEVGFGNKIPFQKQLDFFIQTNVPAAECRTSVGFRNDGLKIKFSQNTSHSKYYVYFCNHNKLNMKSVEQINKIESVLLYVLRNFKEGVDYIKLFKILYFAQREFLATYGKVLVPDTFKARNWGPVPALSDKIIKTIENKESVSNYPNLKGCLKAIKVADKLVFAIKEPNMDYLSKKERECLDKWYNECKDKDSKNELSPASHDSAYNLAWSRCQEDPQQGTLTFIEIARAGGATESMIEYIREKELITAEFCDE